MGATERLLVCGGILWVSSFGIQLNSDWSSAWLHSVPAMAAPAYAATGIDLNVSTPAIRSLKTSIESRRPQLEAFYAKGALGETNGGLLLVRDTSALSLQDKAAVTRLVERENADRQSLYAEILRANNLDQGRMGELARRYAADWQAKAPPGSWIQQDSGTWAKK